MEITALKAVVHMVTFLYHGCQDMYMGTELNLH